MAGAVIGSVGVVVRPITTGLSGQLKRAFSGASTGARGAGAEAGKAYGSALESEAPNAIQRFGSSLSSAMGRWAKRGAIAGGAALGLAVGASVVGGFRSAINQQQGQLVLSGLYEDAGKAKSTLKGLRDMASGSPIDYSAYQSAAESLAYAGAEGDQAIGVLENVGKAITAGGGDTSSMDSATDAILRGVNAGKFQLDTLQQLSNSGVPILSGLSEHFGVSMEEVNKMASDGKIQLEDVMAVMENGTGATFQSMITAGEAASQSFGSQWKIAKDNVVTAIGGQMVPMLETLAPIVGEVGEKITTWISGLDFTPVTTAISGIVGWVKQLDFSSWKGFTDSLAGGGASSAFSSITDSLAELGPAFSDFVGAVKDSGPALGRLAGGVLGLVADGLSFLAEHIDTIVKLLPYLVAGFAAWHLAVKSTAAATAAAAPVYLASNTMRVIGAALDLRAARAQDTHTAATKRATVAQKLHTVATKIGNAAKVVAAGVTRALGVALRFMTGPIGLVIVGITALVAGLIWFFTQTEMGQKLWTRIWGAIKTAALAVVDWFMGTALPVLQAAWDGIAAGALWLYQNAILPAWSGIKTAISAVGTWITGTLWPALQTAWTAIGTAVMWLWQNIIQPAWTGIRIAIAVAITAVLVYIDLLKWYFNNVIAPVALWLWHNVMQPAWNGIKIAIGAVVAWVRDTAWPILKSAWDAIAGAAIWLWQNVLVPAWNGIKGAISAVVAWFRDTAWPIVKSIIDFFALGFRNLYDFVIKPVWNWIKGAIDAVIQWFKNTAWPLIDTVLGWIQQSFEGWKIIIGAVWDFVKDRIINPVISWFRDTAWPLIDRILGSIKRGFQSMKDRLKSIWDSVKNSIIKPVVDWITGTVKPKFDTFTDNVKSAFTTLKDGVLAAWDSIKEGMKKPINGVIGIYNENIKGNFDKVAKKLGLDTRLPEMHEFYTGGYTGPGAKYAPAGVVHADEYVIRKESQNDLRRTAPGFLDALNRHGSKALGYASGGLVDLRMPFAGSYPRGDGFGARGGSHKGIDYPMPSGAVLKAVAAGVASRTHNSAAGNKLELSIGNGLVAGYHHLSSFIAKNGQSVGRGTDVARVGSTGRSSGPHLHFSMKRDGSYVDPAPYLGAGGAAGSGGGSWWNPFDGLWGKIKGKVSDAVGGGFMGDMLTKVASNSVTDVGDWVWSKISSVGDFASDAVAGVGGRARWANTMRKALQMKDQFGPMRMKWGLDRLMQESGGDPNAVNTWDSNARRGTPSKGLMQTIGPTFRSYAEPGYGSNILDPLSNILASINYTLATYGSLKAGWTRSGGYADGGLVEPTLFDSGGIIPPGLTSVLNASGKPEAVLTNDQLTQLRIIASGRGGEGGDTTVNNVYAQNDKAQELVGELMWAQKTTRSRGRYAHAGR